MATFNKTEFWKELDATEESFVRHKLAMGGYSLAKQRMATEWLKRKDEQRRTEREAMELRVAMNSARWSQISAIATTLAAGLGLIALFWPK